MDKIKAQLEAIYRSIPFWKVVGVVVSLEIISFSGFEFAWINTLMFWLLIAIVGIASLKRLHYGILVLFAELVVGSKGYLFSVVIHGHPISIRLGLFGVVFAATVVWMIRERKIRLFEWRLWKPYAALVGALGLAVVVGLLHHNGGSNIFFDANGYLYFGLIIPLTQAVRNRHDIYQLFAVMLAASVVMMGETVVLLFLFAHLETFTYTLPEVYKWIRDTGVGEITRYPNGFSRVFFQSHVYAVFVFCVSGVLLVMPFADRVAFPRATGRPAAPQAEGSLYRLVCRQMRPLMAVFALSALTVFLSYSRSFWVAIAVTVPITCVWLLWKERVSVKRLLIVGLLCAAMCAVDYVAVIAVVNFPLPGHVGVSTSSILTDRTSDIANEAAAASRWQLVKPLFNAALEHPLFGSGFGRTITYKSSDLRVLAAHPDGQYSTYAFEWGYLDVWLKLGAFGFIVYAALCVWIFRQGFVYMRSATEDRWLSVGLLASFVCLLAVNIFTPYLNHPLGIGWILLISIFFTLHEHESRT